MDELTDDEKRMLAFEHGRWWKYAGAKESAILAEFGVSSTRYYQQLNALIGRPEALAHDPLGVRRLRRLQAQRRAHRAAARATFEA